MDSWVTGNLYVQILAAVVVLLATWLAVHLMRRGVDRLVERRGLAGQDPGMLTKFRMIEQLAAAALLVVGVALAFVVLDFAPLRKLAVAMFASVSLMGIILGLAAQTTVANLVSGIVIAFVQPLRLRDWVGVSGEQGEVEEIGLFYTRIRTRDNQRLVIPNKVLSNEVIRNYSLRDPSVPLVMTVRVGYGTDLERVRSLLLEVAGSLAGVLPWPEVSAALLDGDDKGVRLQVVAWAADQGSARRLAGALGRQVVERLGDEGVSISGLDIEPIPAGS